MTRHLTGTVLLLIPLGMTAGPLRGHDATRSVEVRIDTSKATVGATLLLPAGHERVPCVVIAPGSLSQDRDGGFHRAGVPPRDALKRLAEALAAGGYASLRYDKVGHGSSKPGKGWQGTYTQQAEVLAAVIRHARERKELGPVIVAGESAGAYLTCLAAKAGTRADAYLFLGAHCGPGEEIYAYNFGRLVRYVEQEMERASWARGLRMELALGKHYKEMFAAAAAGKDSFELVDGDFHARVGLARRKEELDMPPDEMFRHIRAPALALAGARDRNVPPEHAARAVAIMRSAGNRQATSVLIPGVDHSFQKVPDDEHEQVRERFTLTSFRRPYDPRVYQEILRWLGKTVPTPAGVRALKGVEVDPRTENTPERIHLAPGVEIIDDITDEKKTAGVKTLEGRIGPLILAEDSQAQFIDMPAGMYVKEHPHSSGSLIYTVRGKWVLCSKGRRHVMKPGSLFRFAPDTPTGYEVPFKEDAYILIFKGKRLSKDEKEFIDYLKGLAQRLKKQQKDGTPFLLEDLPKDHPARKYAEKVNPGYRP
jgi:pimeloyl-ACP methyl ester carboxylesterase/quercetin dioxygenase-like cupin family protein